MAAAPGLRLLDLPGVLQVVSTLSRLLSSGPLWLVTLMLAVSCSPAPLAGKACPCASGYKCCDTTQTCVPEGGVCPCASVKLTSPLITTSGWPLPGSSPPNCGTTNPVMFGVFPEQWISYTYAGTNQPLPCLETTPDGNGIHVRAMFADLGSASNSYEGVGLSFLGDSCIDGDQLTGLQFDFAGDLGGRRLTVGVSANSDVSSAYARGTCPADAGSTMCYGPTSTLNPRIGTNQVAFSALTDGMPQATLDAHRIVNVQWQLAAAENPNADFTITSVTFY